MFPCSHRIPAPSFRHQVRPRFGSQERSHPPGQTRAQRAPYHQERSHHPQHHDDDATRPAHWQDDPSCRLLPSLCHDRRWDEPKGDQHADGNEKEVVDERCRAPQSAPCRWMQLPKGGRACSASSVHGRRRQAGGRAADRGSPAGPAGVPAGRRLVAGWALAVLFVVPPLWALAAMLGALAGVQVSGRVGALARPSSCWPWAPRSPTVGRAPRRQNTGLTRWNCIRLYGFRGRAMGWPGRLPGGRRGCRRPSRSSSTMRWCQGRSRSDPWGQLEIDPPGSR